MGRANKFFADVETGYIYSGSTGNQINTNGLPYITSKEKVAQYVQYVSSWVSLTAYNADPDSYNYTEFASQTISSTAVIDNDYNHYDKGELSPLVTTAV